MVEHFIYNLAVILYKIVNVLVHLNLVKANLCEWEHSFAGKIQKSA